MAGSFLEDPNRTSVGLDPIWTGAPDDGPEATGAIAGTPGTWTPAGAGPPASVSDLLRGRPNPVTATPAAAWTGGQYVQTMESGAAGRATWTGSAWVGGVAPGTAGFDPSEHTVAEVEEYAECHPDEVAAIIAAERAGKNRSTLLAALEAYES